MKQSVLIVDDVEDWRDMLAGLIEDYFPHATVVRTGSVAEAQVALAQHKFTLAIVDIRLDESDEDNQDGLSLMEFIHETTPETTVYIVTGYANLEAVKRALQPAVTGRSSADDFFEKESIYKEFIPRIAKLLDSVA